jgi:CubicO group peptidase (beta-lactamase class C family)
LPSARPPQKTRCPAPSAYYWAGAFGTTFYVDPKEQMIIVMMIQVPGPENNFYRRAVRTLAYQALIAAN